MALLAVVRRRTSSMWNITAACLFLLVVQGSATARRVTTATLIVLPVTATVGRAAPQQQDHGDLRGRRLDNQGDVYGFVEEEGRSNLPSSPNQPQVEEGSEAGGPDVYKFVEEGQPQQQSEQQSVLTEFATEQQQQQQNIGDVYEFLEGNELDEQQQQQPNGNDGDNQILMQHGGSDVDVYEFVEEPTASSSSTTTQSLSVENGVEQKGDAYHSITEEQGSEIVESKNGNEIVYSDFVEPLVVEEGNEQVEQGNGNNNLFVPQTSYHQQSQQQQQQLPSPTTIEQGYGDVYEFVQMKERKNQGYANGDVYQFTGQSTSASSTTSTTTAATSSSTSSTLSESCDDTDHPCQNGGLCVNTADGVKFCDCGAATDGNTRYVGKFCEHAVVQYCDEAEGTFCVNGGECNTNYPDFGDPCLCKKGYEGANCQYVSNSVPNCSLQCQHGGQCVFDSPTKQELQQMTDVYQFWGTTGNNPDATGAGDPTFMRCDCTNEYDGKFCETKKVSCGESYCFNGGTCITRMVDGQTVNHCDCTSSYTDENSFAGRYCQYEATSYCTKSSGVNGHLFCVNGGKCKQDPYQGCECDSDYTGFSCELLATEMQAGSTTSGTQGGSSVTVEQGTTQGGSSVTVEQGQDIEFTSNKNTNTNTNSNSNTNTNSGATTILDGYYGQPSQTSCDLVCKNNGTCNIGVKDLGVLNDYAQNAPGLNETHTEDYQHCICPDGYYGLYCEEQINRCEQDGDLLCLHGAKCEFDAQGEEIFWSCDCSTTNSTKADKFAGDACEHPIYDICSLDVDLDATPMSFCVNGGACKKRVTDSEDHPGCNCPDGWQGPHCEVRSQQSTIEQGSPQTSGSNGNVQVGAEQPPTFSSSTQSSSASSSTQAPGRGFEIFVLVISLVAIVLVTVFSVTLIIRNRRHKHERINNMMRWSSSYRDEPGVDIRENVNLAPRRQSSIDYITANTPVPNSSSDPMAAYRAAVERANLNSSEPKSSASVGSDSDPEEPEGTPQVYIGPPRDEDGHELHNVEII